MKNKHITSTLKQIMKSDQQTKLELIACIIAHNKENNPLYNEVEAFDSLYELCISDLTIIVNDCISDVWSSIYAQLSESIRIKGNNPEEGD